MRGNLWLSDEQLESLMTTVVASADWPSIAKQLSDKELLRRGVLVSVGRSRAAVLGLSVDGRVWRLDWPAGSPGWLLLWLKTDTSRVSALLVYHSIMPGWSDDRRTWTPLTAEKRVIIEVIGGDADGLVLDSKDPVEREQVDMILVLTQNGEVGSGMKGMALTKMLATSTGRPILETDFTPGFVNYYWVEERLEEGDEVLIRMRHKGKTRELPA